MSVVGIDFGTQNCVIAVAQKGGIDVITNDVSRRQTPCMVAFTDRERCIGEAALTQYQRNIQNTIVNVKNLLGMTGTEADFQEEIKDLPFKITEDIQIEVLHGGEPKKFTPVALAGMILQKLKEITDQAPQVEGKAMKDVVISVPGFWTDHQRRAMIDACSVAGLNCLRLLNDNTATALGYGIYKSNQFSETEPVRVMFIDMGYSNTSVSIVEYTKGKLTVLSTAYDRTLGGRNFDEILVQHFAKEFKEKFKIDILSNKRARIRLTVACEKLKKILSSNPEGVISVDSIMNDIDVKGKFTRKEFEELCQPLLQRLEPVIQKALSDAKITSEQLHSVEITGSGTRALVVQNKLQTILNRDLSKTLNCEESVARGCALMSAMLSPVFKVREFAVNDIQPYPIKVTWRDIGSDPMDTEGDWTEIYSANSPISVKAVTFQRNEGFDLIAEYANPALLPPGTPTLLGKYTIKTLPEMKEKPVKIRAIMKVDLSGVFRVTSIQASESYEVEVEVEKKEETKEASKKKGETSKEKKDEPNQTKEEETQPEGSPIEEKPKENGEHATDSPKENGETTTPQKEKVKKKKTRRVDMDYNSSTSSLPTTLVQKMIEVENELLANDRLIIETAEKKNALESYVYDTRDKLSTSLSKFATEETKEKFFKLLNDAEEWLYGEGSDVSKSTYIAKLEELKKVGDPIFQRKYESENRYDAHLELTKAIDEYRLAATSDDPKYEHIEKEEKKKIIDKCASIEKEVSDLMNKQSTLPSHVDPVITVAQIKKYKQELDHFCPPILNKPKPAPKEEPKKEEAKKDDTKKDETTKEEKKGQDSDNKEQKKPEDMDLD